MKRSLVGLLAVLLAAMVLAIARPAAAHDYDRGNSDHPLRLIAYSLYPIGIGLEYGVFRLVHLGVSQPHARILFGHAPRNERDERGQYPVCNLDKPAPPTVECPHCHKAILKPRDEYYTWR